MRILVTGASGFIGSHLVEALTDAGHEVVCCAPEPEGSKQLFPHLDWAVGDFTRDLTPTDWIPRLEGIDAVVNAAGIIRERGSQTFSAVHRDGPIALFDACTSVGVRRVIQISALGADDEATSRFHLTKRSADEHLSGLDLDWVILQPSVVIGPGGASTHLFQTLAAMPLLPVVGGGKQMIQPIHVRDLSRAIVRLLEPGAPARARLAAVGPKPLAFKEVLHAFRRRLGLRPARILHIPLSVTRLAVWVGDRTGSGSMTTESLDMLLRGNTADPEPLARAVGFRPGGFEEAFSSSSSLQAERWQARLSVLKPIVRLSIAFIWIATGLISAFVFPVEESYALLSQVGITGALAPAVLYGTSGFEVLLGLATLIGYRIVLVGAVQLVLIAGFTVLITAGLPEFWAHPFGPITKNVPIAAATLVMMVLEEPV